MPLSESDLNHIKLISEAAVAPVLTRLAAGDKEFEGLRATVDKHEVILHGEGKNPGIVGEVRGIRAQYASGIKWRDRVVGAAITALVGGAGIGVVWAIQHMATSAGK